jgi:hypothetical protein
LTAHESSDHRAFQYHLSCADEVLEKQYSLAYLGLCEKPVDGHKIAAPTIATV